MIRFARDWLVQMMIWHRWESEQGAVVFLNQIKTSDGLVNIVNSETQKNYRGLKITVHGEISFVNYTFL